MEEDILNYSPTVMFCGTPFIWKYKWEFLEGLKVFTVEYKAGYRVTHKEWDWKDDGKVLKYGDPKVKWYILPEI